ncbi:hypothetical protein AGDE_07464 [Angomonas deanei]|uniref:Uncharacterized protein n=1 Tax=Angomonas deanei TaxID=59799 RepID=A0A7G2CJG6_9TRYP|nr:hypothetical protein AGDE_07464 [Angomonas deanei]CAD2220008.1 hypothetical protein, conserved [Angomonas deanei]|eukprot:EPY35320.1 hypothetical protein AGDE_07464 [Angomonas deanei]
MEVSNLTLRLQQQFSATQTQVDNIKLHIQQQLGNPITEEEYTQLDALPENKRDLLDTIKIGIFRQMGSLRASHQSATKRCAEMSAAVARLEGENRDHLLHIEELKKQVETLNDKFSDKLGGADKQYQRILELEAQNKELEGKLRTFFLSQEDFLKARLTAQVKTDEVARLAVRLEQAELDVERFKAVAECTEQKLDILKSEYYEMKLAHQQRQLELEAALKAADQKLKHVGDLELESELFLSNYSREAGETGGSELLNAFPQSRKMAHAVSVTKKCLHLENKAALLEQDLKARDTQILRLKSSLEAAREALHNSNSPYALIEKTMNDISAENELLRSGMRHC